MVEQHPFTICPPHVVRTCVFAKSKQSECVFWRQRAFKYEKLSPRRKLPTEMTFQYLCCGRVLRKPPPPQERQAEGRKMRDCSHGVSLSDVPQVIRVGYLLMLVECAKDDQRICQVQDFAGKNNFRIAS